MNKIFNGSVAFAETYLLRVTRQYALKLQYRFDHALWFKMSLRRNRSAEFILMKRNTVNALSLQIKTA